MLTAKQLELLKHIDKSLRENGIPPSYDEMKIALGLNSKSGIHRLITALEERGYIRRLPNRARALEIAKLPESMSGSNAQPRVPFSPSVVEGGRRDVASAGVNIDRTAFVPMMGRIAAGTPIEAIQSHTSTIAVPPDMLTAGEHYALEVRGDSMIEAGIFDGDTVVVRRQDDASSGEIVVALIDGEEATLKRLRRKGTMIGLEAANAAYETRILPSDRVSIQGRMVGLMRKY